VVHHLAAAAVAAMVMAVAAMARDEAHEEAAEEDGADDEDAACHDADPSGDGVQSPVSTCGHDRLGHGCDGLSTWWNGLDWPGLGFGRRCFAHVLDNARRTLALGKELAMNRL
jgi:hypothetical protein